MLVERHPQRKLGGAVYVRWRDVVVQRRDELRIARAYEGEVDRKLVRETGVDAIINLRA
jgi:hypothetical protein